MDLNVIQVNHHTYTAIEKAERGLIASKTFLCGGHRFLLIRMRREDRFCFHLVLVRGENPFFYLTVPAMGEEYWGEDYKWQTAVAVALPLIRAEAERLNEFYQVSQVEIGPEEIAAPWTPGEPPKDGSTYLVVIKEKDRLTDSLLYFPTIALNSGEGNWLIAGWDDNAEVFTHTEEGDIICWMAIPLWMSGAYHGQW